MEKSSPINSVYLIALAVCSLSLVLNSFFTALIYSIVVVSVFLVSISIVSMIEKIADKHIRFLLFALVSAAILTILKIVCGYISVPEILYVGDNMEYAILPCLMLAIVPIYFEQEFTMKEFFVNSLLVSAGVLLMMNMAGVIVEMLAYGSVAGVSIAAGFSGFATLRHGFTLFFVVASLAILFNMVRRAYLKKTRRFNMLVEKYKIQIRSIRDTELKQSQAAGGKKDE